VCETVSAMRPSPDILVLLHERDRWAERENYLLWPIRQAWLDLGLRVGMARGARQAGPAKVLFPHVDLTVTPPEIVELYGRYEHVVNRKVVDISKRTISRLLVSEGDPWQGPVIVKTDLNTGGAPERRLARVRAEQLLRVLTRRLTPKWLLSRRRARIHPAPLDLATASTLPPNHYPIFPSAAALPPGVFTNAALVVERFVPEREGDLYVVRSWSFLGSSGYNHKRVSRAGVVRAIGVLRREPAEVPVDLQEVRRALGFDYGKLDYVVHEGQAVLLDANRTPCLAGDTASALQRERARKLAIGIAAWLDPSLLELASGPAQSRS
jgi:hypothetical protein